MQGIWAAALVPFADDLAIDEQAFRRNLRHWIDDLGIDGIFVGGKQSEFFSMSLAERKRIVEITVDEIGETAGVIASCSDQNMDTVIELARHAQSVGAPYIVVHAPVLHFLTAPRRNPLSVLQNDLRAGRHRHRDVEPRGFRLSHESGTVRTDRRAAEYRRHQIQRAATRCTSSSRKWSATKSWSAPPRKPSGSTISSSSAGGSISARRRPTCTRPKATAACATTPISRSKARSPGRKSSATVLNRCAKRSGGRGRPKSPRLTPNTGKNCSGRRADVCARRCSN